MMQLTGQQPATKWDKREITFDTMKEWEAKLLFAFWEDELQRRVDELGTSEPCRSSPYASIVAATNNAEHNAKEGKFILRKRRW